jgi:hypothetical protein
MRTPSAKGIAAARIRVIKLLLQRFFPLLPLSLKHDEVAVIHVVSAPDHNNFLFTILHIATQVLNIVSSDLERKLEFLWVAQSNDPSHHVRVDVLFYFHTIFHSECAHIWLLIFV